MNKAMISVCLGYRSYDLTRLPNSKACNQAAYD